MQKIALFVPTHNEEETIDRLLSRIPRTIRGYPTELVIADDGSTDNTALIAQRHTPHVLTMRENQGVGACTKRGLAHIATLHDVRHVIKFDGDGQHDPHFLPCVAEQLDKGADLVICSRFHPESDQDHAPYDRIVLNHMFANEMSFVTGLRITDARSGYMGFPFRYVSMLARDIKLRGYGIPMEIVFRIWNANRDAIVCEIPHPAMYGPNISDKLFKKYSSETVSDKADRLHVAFEAYLTIIKDLKLSREDLVGAGRLEKMAA